MALEIVEYANLATDARGRAIAAGEEPAVARQSVTVAGSSTDSAAFAENTRFVRLHAVEAVRIDWGSSPTASAASQFRMEANQTEFVGVNPAVSGMKLATFTG